VNAKIEVLWSTVEGQLMAMLESVADLTLEFLNEATQAWAEFGYNRTIHSEIDATPLARWAAGPVSGPGTNLGVRPSVCHNVGTG
jgi:putative transposase